MIIERADKWNSLSLSSRLAKKELAIEREALGGIRD